MAPPGSSRAGHRTFTAIVTTARIIRACASGASSLIIARWLSALRYTDTQVTYFVILLLLGKYVRNLVVDSIASRHPFVAPILESFLMLAVGTVFAALMEDWTLWTAGMVGVVDVGILCTPANGSGVSRAKVQEAEREFGSDGLRSSLLDVEFLGRVVGTLICGLVMQSLQARGWTQFASYCIVWWLFAATGVLNAALYMIASMIPQVTKQNEEALNEEAEWGLNELDNSISELDSPNTSNSHTERSQVTPHKSPIRLGLCFLESTASGILAISLVALFLEKRLSLLDYHIGIVAAALYVLNAVAELYAPRWSELLLSFREPAKRSGEQIGTFFSKPGSRSTVRRFRGEDDEERPAAKIVELFGQCIGVLMTGALAGTSYFWLAFAAGLMLTISGLFFRSL